MAATAARAAQACLETVRLAELARLLAVMQQECGAMWPSIHKGVGASAGGEHQRAVAGRERLGRLSVQGHHLDLVTFQFDRQNRTLRAIDKAQPQPLIGAAESSNEVRPLIV